MIALWIATLATAAALAYVSAGLRSIAVALFYLAFLPFATLDASAGGLVSAEAVAAGSNALWKAPVRALGMAAVVALAARRARAVADVILRPASLPIVFLVAWAMLGLPRASDPWVAFFRLGELFAFFVAGVVLYVEVTRNARTHDVARIHALALVAPLVAAVVLAHVQPELAFHESSGGIRRMGHKFMNSNVLGFCAAVVLLWATYVLRTACVLAPDAHPSGTRRERLIAWIALALAAYVLYHARSRTAALTAVVGQVVLWAPWPSQVRAVGIDRQRVRLGALLGLAALALAVAGLREHVSDWFVRGADTAEVMSGTERTGLRSDLLAYRVPEAPLLGSSDLNLSTTGTFEHAGHTWNNAHNTYLFALVATDVPGLLAVCAIVALPLLATKRRMAVGDAEERSAWTLLFAFQCMVALASVTGFGISGYPNVAMLFHYGLFAFATRPLSLSTEGRSSARSAELPLHDEAELAYAGE